MKSILRLCYSYVCIITFLTNNTHAQSIINDNISLKLLNEKIIKSNLQFKNTKIGGLSSIDYANKRWFTICDDSKNPIRFYELDLTLSDTSFDSIRIKNVHFLKDEKNQIFLKNTIDGESLRFDDSTNKIIWTSEGNIKNNIPPALFEADINTSVSKAIKLEGSFSNSQNFYHNGAFESLSISHDAKGYWIASEYPLKNDGHKPSYTTSNSPVRFSYIDKQTIKCTKQYAYLLEKVALKSKNKISKGNNGLVEILALNATQFLTLERSYTPGMENTIRLFLTSVEETTTNLVNTDSLINLEFNPMKKELILDFKTIKNELPSRTIDNIEGMCFGPDLNDGSKTLVFISDDNFNRYGNQITQVIAFKFSYLN